MSYDPKKPYNGLPKLPPQQDFNDVKLLKLVNIANIALSELNGTARTLSNRFLIMEPFYVKEAVASSGVENIHTTVSEVFKAEILPSETSGDSKETLHYRDALMKGFDFVKVNKFLSTNQYVEMQELLEPKKAGIRKINQTTEPVRIENKDTGEVVYTPPAGEELIRDFLKNFDDFYNSPSEGLEDLDPLIKMAILHYQFEAIHPFRDGNGRLGRILMVLYLVINKRLDLPVLFLSGYILRNKEEYYRRIRRVTEKNEWIEWVTYMLNAVITQSKETSGIVLRIKKLKSNYIKIAKGKNLPDSSEFVDYLFGRTYYNYANLSEKMKVHVNTATRYLNSLEQEKILKKIKIGREVLFYNPALIEVLEEIK